jgi:hypothetical protein
MGHVNERVRARSKPIDLQPAYRQHDCIITDLSLSTATTARST